MPTLPSRPSRRSLVLATVLALSLLAGCTTGPPAPPPDGGDSTDPVDDGTDGPPDDGGNDTGYPLSDLPSADGDRLMALVERQVYNGTDTTEPRYRVPGTAGHEATVPVLADMLEAANLTVEQEHARVDLPRLGTVNATNLYGIREGTDPSGGEIWLAAHWDSRAWADAEGPSCEGPRVLGANDGAAAVAVVVHALERLPATERTVRVALFDAEDQGCGGQGWIQGSTYAAEAREQADTLDEIHALILVDMPGASTLTIPREGNGAVDAPRLTDLVFGVAEQIGAERFHNTSGPGILDDHRPFLERGVPAVDLVHLDDNGTSVFPWMWHTTEDTPAHLSEASMSEVTRVVMGATLALDRGGYTGEAG